MNFAIGSNRLPNRPTFAEKKGKRKKEKRKRSIRSGSKRMRSRNSDLFDTNFREPLLSDTAGNSLFLLALTRRVTLLKYTFKESLDARRKNFFNDSIC